MSNDVSDSGIGLFPLGRICVSERLTKLISHRRLNLMPLVIRHVTGDWGLVDGTQRQLNDASLRNGGPIDSAHVVETGVKVLIRTEADRSATTLIVAEENLQ